MQALTDREFSSLRELFYSLSSIWLGDEKKYLVQNRILKRLHYLHLKNYEEYYDFLMKKENKAERDIFVDLVTTHETSFFREPGHFHFLARVFRRAAVVGKSMRIWCAACSTGEEAYSMAMLAMDNLKHSNWELWASDVSLGVLKKASRGVYPVDSSGSIPRYYLSRYCLKGVRSMSGFFMISQDLRRKINFRKIDLGKELPELGEFDCIFLRNVIIYFDFHMRKKVVEGVAGKLRPGGLIVLGHAESMSGQLPGLAGVAPAVYKKI